MVITNYGNSFNDFNYNYFRREIPKAEDITLQQNNTDIKPEAVSDETINIQAVETERILPVKDVISYALNSDLKVDKTLIGSEKDIMGLDLEKAVSDVKKDSLLSQYTYFVGNISTEDGSVTRMKRTE